MPRVGNKRFAYTPEGYREAQEYARKTGQKVVVTRPAKRRRKRKGTKGG